MNNILEGLNKEQLQAVTHKEGPLLIIAGAGTGKTTVITRRIAWLLSEGLAKTGEILALTFTDKASHEMQERVDILVPYGYTDIWISTFHAFGDRILRENAIIAGLDPDFKVLTQSEAAVFFREHLFEFELSYFRPLADPTAKTRISHPKLTLNTPRILQLKPKPLLMTRLCKSWPSSRWR
ncbi:MAG: ATP-dependent helicase [Candidatus Omnitrophica bacterium]|nr:ATP-dependent helicase [Candidatus Omnitrophota bacterium]